MIKLVSDTINKEDIDALVKWLQQDPIPRLTKGDLTWELEKKWAEKIGTKYSVFVNSGSSSILLTLAALKQSKKLKNKRIVVPTLSWATDVSSPMLLGLEPIFCDCNLEDLSCDLRELERIFKNKKPSAFILVSPLGLVPKMKEIVELCEKYNVILLEDVCESMGSKYQDRYLGTFGFASFFSMYFGHHLSTIEGGFINTNDEELYHYLLMMRNHGWDRDLPEWKQQELRKKYKCSDFDALYNFYVPGFNLRATDLQAFLGLRAIDKLDGYSCKRNENFHYYLKFIKLKGDELDIHQRNGDFISSFAYPVVKKLRNQIVNELKKRNVEVRPLIAGNMARKPFCYHEPNRFLISEMINKYGFYLPNHQDLKEEEIDLICNIINKF